VSRLWRAAGIATALTVLLFGFYSVGSSAQMRQLKRISENRAEETARLVGAYLQVYQNALCGIAEADQVRDERIPLSARLRALQSRLMAGATHSAFIVDRSGAGVSTGGERRDFADSPAFLSAARGEPCVSSPFTTAGQSGRIFAIAVPIFHEHRIEGVLVQNIPWHGVASLVETADRSGDGAFYLLTREELSSGRKPTHESERPIVAVIDETTRERAAGGEIASTTVTVHGASLAVAYAPVRDTDWIVAFRQPAMPLQNRGLWGGFGFLALVAFACVYWFPSARTRRGRAESSTARDAPTEAEPEQQGDDLYREVFDLSFSAIFVQTIARDQLGKAKGLQPMLSNRAAEALISGLESEADRRRLDRLLRDADRFALIEPGDCPQRLDDVALDDGRVLNCVAFSPRRDVAVIACVDGTAETQAKKTIEDERAKLMKATLAAEEANRSKSRILAALGREIRGPIGEIIALADRALATGDENAHGDALAAIERSARNLLIRVNDLVDHSRLESGKLGVEKINFRLEDVVANALTAIAPRLAAKRVTLTLDYSPSLPDRVVSDPLRIWQILKALLDVALERRENATLRLRVSESNYTALLLEIKGPAVAMGPASDAAEEGLSAIREYVNLLQGSIEVSESTTEGTIYSVALPMEIGQPSVKGMQITSSAEKCRGSKVLVVTADDDLAAILRDALNRAGIVPAFAPTHTAAERTLRQAKNGEGDYFAILLAPRPDAAEITRVTSHAAGLAPNALKLLLLPGWATHHVTPQALRAGRISLLEMPFVPSRLLRKLTEEANPEGADDRAQDGESGGRAAGASVVTAHSAFEGRRILIAEDNRQARESLIRSLAGFGIEPDVACNGMEARELARQAEYDLILLDSLMPEMDGATAARLIRQDAALTGKKRATILALSAQTNETSLRECLEAGMDGSVAKPSEGGTLHGTMQSAFRGDLHDALHATLERWLAEASPAGAGSEHI